ncbi:hypothetical protein [Polluticoccus soli]|uniref:hypothetical protein n=1 Tax=Polluticoccus soli TaxID=3034150 RepID=UPI0023E0D02A|nr:hypothetical protein [Flavipsychrobacter sp. JY13-12]
MLGNFFPGSYNVDTWNQYFEAQNNKYNDWHSPWVAYIWHHLLNLTDRFFSMYIFQMLWYFLFFYCLLKNVTNKLTILAGLVSSLVLVFTAQYLMKDTHIALAWGTAAVIMANGSIKQKKSGSILVFLLITYGFFIRPNAIPAILPLLYVWVEWYFAKHQSRVRKLAVASVLTLTLPAAYYFATYNVLKTERAFPEYKLRLLDVIGISKNSGQNYMPQCVTSFAGYNQQKIDSMYSPATIDHIYWPADNVLMLPEPTREINDCVGVAWKTAVKAHPGLYLKNRFKGFLYYLKLKRRYESQEYWNTPVYVVKNNYIPIDDSHTYVTKKLLGMWNKLDKIRLYDPWLWLLANSVLMVVFMVRYSRGKFYLHKIMALTQLSAIAFMLGMLPVYQLDLDFRYNYWNVYAFAIGCIYLFRDTIFKKQKQERPQI